MRKYFILSLVLFSCILKAENIDVATVKQAATAFVQSKLGAQKSAVLDVVLKETITAENTNTPLMYVFDVQPMGFVIMSANNDIIPILGYSFDNNYASNPALDMWMTAYKYSIINKTSEKSIHAKNRNAWADLISGNTSTRGTVVVRTPLLTTRWDQNKYYNTSCPLDSKPSPSLNLDGHCATGCVATAMAQIIRFWQYPAVGLRSSSYYHVPPAFAQNFGLLEAHYDTTHYNWSNMPAFLNKYNSDVANLIYQCGVSVFMDYDADADGSGAQTASTVNSFQMFFGYNSAVTQLTKDGVKNSVWDTLMMKQLDNGYPVLYSGSTYKGSGHAWVMDGYEMTNDTAYFHMNWGWSGDGNAYFCLNDSMSSMSSESSGTGNFRFTQAAVVNIYPKGWNGHKSGTGIADNQNTAISQMSIYPNPNNGAFSISYNSVKVSQISLVVTDLLGRVVMTKELNSSIGNNLLDIDAGNLPKGTYIVKLSNDACVKISKIVVE